MTIQQLKLGNSASHSKTINETDMCLFAGITSDLNPAHINESMASVSRFDGQIAHGILGAGLISAVLIMQLPGPGTVYLGQELRFIRPVRFEDTVTATCTVSEIRAKKNIVKLDTVCTNQAGEVVLWGMATVMPPQQQRFLPMPPLSHTESPDAVGIWGLCTLTGANEGRPGRPTPPSAAPVRRHEPQ